MKKKFQSLIIFCFWLISAVQAGAAEFHLNVTQDNLVIGDRVEIISEISSIDASINAIEGELHWSGGLNLTSINHGNSVISPWIVAPQETDGVITFSGIIPNGYQGEARILFSSIFEVISEKAEVNISGEALLNDGLGTSVLTNSDDIIFNIISGRGGNYYVKDYENDIEKPESFEIILSRDPNINEGKPFIVFETQDKFSGIEIYEIAKSKPIFIFKPFTPKKWEETKSPVFIDEKDLNNFIFIKATDHSGNERVSFLAPSEGLYKYKIGLIWSIITLLLVLFIIVWIRNKRGE